MSEINSKTINTEQFYAGALLKFGWLDNVDMVILLEDLRNLGIKFLNSKGNIEIRKYMQNSIDGITSLGPSYTMATKVASKLYGVILLRRKLELMMNNTAEEYFSSIDLNWFVLKKIKYLLDSRGVSDLEDFNPLEQDVIFELLNNSLISRKSSDEEEFDIVLTNLGMMYLFKIENKDLVEQFTASIISEGYFLEDLDRYLLHQNLYMDVNTILDLNRFKNFYHSLTPYKERS